MENWHVVHGEHIGPHIFFFAAVGAAFAGTSGMGFKKLSEIKAYLVARQLKLEVYRLVKSHPTALSDLKFRGQLFDAVASVEMNIAEGFRRFGAREFAYYVKVARGSLEETTGWLQDGVDRGHFRTAACRRALELADEVGRLTMGLLVSLQPFITKAKPNQQTSRRTKRSQPTGGRKRSRPMNEEALRDPSSD